MENNYARFAFTVKIDWLKMKKIDVVIIGSGIAGLTTAYYLQKSFKNERKKDKRFNKKIEYSHSIID